MSRYVLPPSHTATLLIVLNLLTILLSTLILHLGFFGRLLALYKRNLLRVQFLTRLLKDISEHQLDAWWNCRNFVLNDDLGNTPYILIKVSTYISSNLPVTHHIHL